MFTLLSVPSHDMAQQIRMAEQDDVPLKIAVMIGNHPAMAMFAATPVNYDEIGVCLCLADDGQSH